MRAYPLFFGLTALSIGATLLAACSGDVITDESSGSVASTSTSTSTSTSGSASSGSGGAGGGGAGSGGVSDGGGSSLCGGFVGAECAPTEWCDYPDGLCGGDDSAGLCQPRPNGCDDDCPGVCGCDGKFYCNACVAQAEGVDLSDLASCAPPGSDSYTAEAFFGGLDHLFIRKADKVRDICVGIHLARPAGSSAELSIFLPAEWGALTASISNHASNCDMSSMSPVGESVQALGGAGVVMFNTPAGKFFPCDVSVHVKLSFPEGKPWVNATEPLDADGVIVKNGCQ